MNDQKLPLPRPVSSVFPEFGRNLATTGTQYTGPKIGVKRGVLSQMGNETLQHPDTETGEALVGLRTPEWLIILSTIPDLQDTVRQAAYFVQGGSDQVVVYDWMNRHWQEQRERSRGEKQLSGWTPTMRLPRGIIPVELDRDFKHRGDYHRHPGQFKTLSGTDHGTIDDLLLTTELDEYLAPIVTTTTVSPALTFQVIGQEIVGDYGMKLQMNWYYFSKKDHKTFWRVVPEVIEDDCLPWLPPLPWHLKDRDRMQYELSQLRRNGCTVKWAVRQMDNDPVMEIIFAVDRDDWATRMVIVTDWDYPKSAPQIKLYPKNPPVPVASPVIKTTKVRRGRSIVQPFEEWLKRVFAPRPTNREDFWSLAPQPWMDWNTRYLADVVREKENELRGPTKPPTP